MSLFAADVGEPTKGPGGMRTQQKKAPLRERKDDLYETPPIAVEKLLTVERFIGPIWEPACGRGAIVRPLELAGYQVIATDLVDRDFGIGKVDFLMETKPLAPNCVTNPPYRMADEFARQALNLCSGKTAMLMRLVWLSGQRRRPFLEQYLSRVWVFSARLPTMHRDGWEGTKVESSSVDFAWFIFDRTRDRQRPEIGWI